MNHFIHFESHAFSTAAPNFLQGTTPVYNLLPDILSNLSSEPDLPEKAFQDIMRHLLQYIGKEKHADSLADKLCARFEGTGEVAQWRNVAFCIAQVGGFLGGAVRPLAPSVQCSGQQMSRA